MIRDIAAQAWAFRARVEREATLRFARLADEISAFDPASPVPALMRRAADDERRHALLCAELSGAALPDVPDQRIAPRSFALREAALYETVAACCVTETESVATVTTLLEADAEPRVREVLHEIARDEVVHSRMGWAHLAREATALEVAFLSRWIPPMLAGAAGPSLFAPYAAELDSPELLRFGVLPMTKKREIFAGTLTEVVFPGLEQLGISSAPARAWLEEVSGRFRGGGASSPR